MKILINASNLSSAGGLTVALNFLDHVIHRQEHDFYLLAPPHCGYEKYLSKGVTCFFLSKWQMAYGGRIIYDHVSAPAIINQIKPDVIFTMGNFAIPIKNYRQVVLFAWPYPLYPESIVWKMFSLKQRVLQKIRLYMFNERIKYASTVLPQTAVAMNRFKRFYPKIKDIRVVPNSYSVITDGKESAHDFSMLVTDKKNLLCLTRYYLHKNVEVLLKVAEVFKNKQRPYRIVLTLGEDQHINVKHINEYIKKNALEDYIINIGPVAVSSVPKLYSYCQALILPTLLESFSGTYIDSMHLGKSIFTSDMDFARQACGDVAFYFDPHSYEDIANVVDGAFENKEVIKQKIEEGKNVMQHMPDWQKVADTYMEILTQ